jgi:hypothetical protein
MGKRGFAEIEQQVLRLKTLVCVVGGLPTKKEGCSRIGGWRETGRSGCGDSPAGRWASESIAVKCQNCKPCVHFNVAVHGALGSIGTLSENADH